MRRTVLRSHSLDPEAWAVQETRRFLAEHGRIENDADVLAAGRLLFSLGSARASCCDEDSMLVVEELIARLRRLLARVPRSAPSCFLERCRRARLSPLEREILLFLVLNRLGMLQDGPSMGVPDIDDVQQALQPTGVDGLDVLRALAPTGRLAASGLVVIEEGEAPVDSSVHVERGLLWSLWIGEQRSLAWPVSSWSAFLDRLQVVAAAVERQERENAQARDCQVQPDPPGSADHLPPRFAHLLHGVEETLEQHPDWPLGKVFQGLRPPERFLVLILACRELGHLEADAPVFRGERLARLLARMPHQTRARLRLLRREGRLRSRNLLQPAAGPTTQVVHEDEHFLRLAEWELTEEACKALRLPRRPQPGGSNARPPRVSLDRVVLPPEVRSRVEEVLLHARHGDVLYEKWGLNRVLPYGRGLGVLFSGPPGTGKTATAEAIAHALDRDILVVDYSALQSMWAGQTEKNVVRVFREAARQGCVLFFDEADAVFFDRESATRSWEAREVNVLLQELENFPGICILATNREAVLDSALARRLQVKVHFPVPGPAEAEAIWRLHLPGELPLAPDVDPARLARLGLTGGQIRNAVLQAARAALARAAGSGRQPRVTQADLERAARLERAAGGDGEGLGFRPARAG